MYRFCIRILGHDLLHVKCRNFNNRTGDDDRSACLCAVGFQFFLEPLLCNAALVIAILSLVHSKLEEFLVVLASVPAFLFHHLDEARQIVRECVLRNAGVELETLLLYDLLDFRSKFSRKLTHLAEDHVHGVLVDGLPSRLALEHMHEVHQGGVLHVLAERGYQWWITESWPYIFYLLEQHHNQLVDIQFLLSLVSQRCVDCALESLQVGHH